MNLNARTPYRAAFAAMTLVLLVACSAGQGPKIEVDDGAKAKAALDAAMQADRDYAALALSGGLNAAAEKYIDLVGGERYVAGRTMKGEQLAAFFKAASAGLKIEWAPDGGHAAASGDLAVTTGRYTATMDGKALGGGRYMSVWRKAGDAWKVAMDADIADPANAAVVPAGPGPTPDKPDFEGRPG